MWVSPVSRRSARLSAFAVLSATFAALAALFFATTATAEPATKSYIVVLNDDVAHPANVAERHEVNRGAEIGHIYGAGLQGYSADLTPGELRGIRQDPNVDFVVPDAVLHVDAQIPSTGAQRVFANTNPGLDIDEIDDIRTNVDVAILDTGVSLHPDLNVVSRTNCRPSSGCTSTEVDDEYGHGTHVAGIVGALDNNFGVVGTAPGARIWSVKAGDSKGFFEMSDIIAGVNWITARSAQIEVVNMSLDCEQTCNGSQVALHAAIAASIDQGVVYVVSAGNQRVNVSGSDQVFGGADPTYPAAFPDVITVSALSDFDGAPGGKASTPKCPYADYELKVYDDVLARDQDDTLADYSNWGPAVDIAAPGTCIRSTVPGGEYQYMTGTSMASPMVAGAVAGLAAAKNPNNRAEVEAIRNYIRALGNYNWTDQHLVVTNVSVSLEGDGIQEPLLDMSLPAAPPPPLPPPTVTTSAPIEVKPDSAKFMGWVNPNGGQTNFYFQYGTTTGYGNTAPALPGYSVGSGVGSSQMGWTIGGLQALTTYHYRIVATNAAGTSYGADQAFTTLAYPAPGGVTSGGQPYVYFGQPSGTMKGQLQEVRNNGTAWVKTGYGYANAVAGTPSAVATSDGSRYIYYRGTDNSLRGWWINGSNWHENQWGSTGAMGSDPATVKTPDGSRYVYFRDANGALRQWWFNGSNWNETNYGYNNAVLGTPAAVATSDGSRYVYYRGTDNALHGWWINGSNWHETQWGSTGAMGSDPTVVLTPDGSRYVYFRDANGALRQWWFNGSNWNETNYGYNNAVLGTPAAVATSDGSRYVYYRGTDGAVHGWWIKGSNWNEVKWGYANVMGSDPGAILGSSDVREAFYADKGGVVNRWWFQGNAWNQGPIG